MRFLIWPSLMFILATFLGFFSSWLFLIAVFGQIDSTIGVIISSIVGFGFGKMVFSISVESRTEMHTQKLQEMNRKEIRKKIDTLDLPNEEQFTQMAKNTSERMKIMEAIFLFQEFKSVKGELSSLPALPAWAKDEKLHWIASVTDNSSHAALVWSKLIDENGKWLKGGKGWPRKFSYESGLPLGFESGKEILFLGLAGGNLIFVSSSGKDFSIALENIIRTQTMPNREKAHLRIAWRDRKRGMRDTVIYMDAYKEVTTFQNGHTRTDWDNSEAIREIDKLQQEILHAQEQIADTNENQPIDFRYEINTSEYRRHLEKMIKNAASPKEILTDVHGILESMLHEVMVFASPHIKPPFAELIQYAHEEGLINNYEALHAARKVRNNRSHRAHEVTDQDCLDAAKAYVEAVRSFIREIENRAADQSDMDWRNELVE